MGQKQVVTGLVVCLSILLILLVSLFIALLPNEVVADEEPPAKEVFPTIIDVPMGTTTRVGDFYVKINGFEYKPYLGRSYEGSFIGVTPDDYFLIIYAEVTNAAATQRPLPVHVYGSRKYWYSEQADLELNADLFFKNRLQTGILYEARIPYEVDYGEQHEVRLYLDDKRYKRITLIKPTA